MSNHPLHTRLCEDFGLEFPIVAFSHCKDVIAAVINSGGLGVFGAVGSTPEEISAAAAWIRERVGDKPFGMDTLMPASVPSEATFQQLKAQIPQTHWDFMEKIKGEFNLAPPKKMAPGEQRNFPRGKPGFAGGQEERLSGSMTHAASKKQFETMLDLRVPIIASGLGSPGWIVEAAHARGISVWGLIGRVRQAVREAQSGVDYIIAQGYDAGGHTGEVGTFSLVPRVAESVAPVPVIAAGGVGSGRHLVASMALGAVGVWTGTLWIASRESDAHIAWKEKLIEASEDDTVRSRCLTGKPVRQIKTAWTEIWERPDCPGPLPMPLQGILVNEVLTAIADHDRTDLMNALGGQGVGMIKEMKSCRQIVVDMVGEAQEVIDRIGGLKV